MTTPRRPAQRAGAPIARAAVLLIGLAAATASAQVITDDFNDGNDTGWTRAVPLAAIGGSATFSFPNGNSYLMASAVSPNPGAAGTARVGAYRADATYTSFRIEADLVDWDAALDQDIGLLARVSSPGLGTLNGYAWSYETGDDTVYLSRLDGEAPTTLGSAGVVLTPGQPYRFVFQGFGSTFCGEIYDPAVPEFPIAIVIVLDSAHESGFGGLFNNAVPPDGTTSSTFDNYRSSPDTDVDKDGMDDQWEFDHFGELFWFDDEDFDGDGQTNLEEFVGGSDPTDPGSLAGLHSVAVTGGDVVVSFPLVANRTYALEISTDLALWIPQPAAVFADHGATGSLTLPAGGQSPLFVRVVATVN